MLQSNADYIRTEPYAEQSKRGFYIIHKENFYNNMDTDMNKELFVSPDGNDSAEGSINAPLRTLVGAKSKVKQIYDGNTPVTVYFRGGIYAFSENTAIFTSEDSAVPGAGITYRAYKNEKPLFEGGISIDVSKAVKVTDENIKSRIIDAYAREHLHEIDISSYIELMPEPSQTATKGTQLLFKDGEPMNFARWPDKKHKNKPTNETWLFAPNIIHGDPPRSTPFNVCTDYSVIDHIERFWSEDAVKNAWMAGYLYHNWSYDVYKVMNIDSEHNAVVAQDKDCSLSYLCEPEPCFKYRRYYFYNVLEELSDPLEFYIDYEKKVLYCCLENNSRIHLFTGTEPVITFDGAENITVDGLSFAYSLQKFIYGNNSKNITIQNCDISRGAEDGVDFCGCVGLRFLNNHVYYMGSNGILAHGAGNMKTLTSGDMIIEGNDIHDVSLKKPCGSCTINLWSSVGTVVRRNKLHSSPHMLMFIDGIDTIVEYNELYDAVLDTDDAAAIYWGRTACTIGTRIRYNYMHDIGQNSTGTWSIGAVYTDDNATGAEIYGNLFINAAVFGDDDMYRLNCRRNAVVCLNAAQFAYVHDNLMLMSTQRETPMTDTCRRDTIEWVKGSIGAYIPGNGRTRGIAMQWRENLQGIGFYSENGIDPNPLWRAHYENTCWSDMFELLSGENYTAGAEDGNGKKYGIPDIRKKFESGELDEEQAAKAFDAYVSGIVAAYGENYSTDKFERNIIIGMNPELLDENGVFCFNNTPNSRNIYITKEQAEQYFKNIHGNDYTLTPNGIENVAKVIPGFNCLENL